MVGLSAASFHRQTASTRKLGIASAALALLSAPSCRADQVLVASLVDDITFSDIISGGSCNSGCRREEHAIAHVSGTPETESCMLQTISPFDSSTPEPGLLRASVYCEDASGNLIEQNNRPCIFDICVDFAWNNDEGELTYDVVIERESRPSAPHTIYVDLSVAIDPTAANTDVDSCTFNGTCSLLECVEPNAYSAIISMTDTYGDGWVGGVAGTYNTWELQDLSDDSIRTSGTLADNHESATIKECLPDGEFLFHTTANAAFADEIGWGICDQYGFAGEGLRFTVANGECDSAGAVKIERATAEETDDASYSYCTLPAPASSSDYRTDTCTALSSGMKIEGVGLFYDDRCNSADYSGCGARSIPACRLCFYDKERWLLTYPDDRVPDWEECPCCVAEQLGVECATGGSSGGTDEAVIIGVSVGIAGVIAIACCLSCAFGTTIVRFFRRMKKKKDAEDRLDLDTRFGTTAFPESPSNGETMRGATGLTTQGNRDRGRSGHFPIPRFDSIRGRFDSGIFSSGQQHHGTAVNSSNSGATGGPQVIGDDLGKVTVEQARVTTTALSTPSGGNNNVSDSGSGNGASGSTVKPRSTLLDDRLVAKGFTAADVGRPVSSSSSRRGSGSGGAAGWGLALSGEYPDLEGSSDPYAVDNAMAETGTAAASSVRGSGVK